MEWFSRCVGKCCVCQLGNGGCLAGHGDDDFRPAPKEEIIRRLDAGEFKSWEVDMIAYLWHRYGYDYENPLTTTPPVHDL